MARKRATGATPAVSAVTAAGVGFTLHTYDHDPGQRHFGDETIAVLGLDPDRVLKTLVVDIGTGRPPLAVAVVPVAGQLDLKAMAAALGLKKVEMADPAAAERATGYVVGGISPFGQRTPLRTVVDASALGHATVYCSGGKRGLTIELAPADLVRLTGAVVAPIARPA